MPECLHCNIIEFLDQELQGNEANLVENAAKVIEVLSYLILIVPLKEGSALMADKAAWETIKAGGDAFFRVAPRLTTLTIYASTYTTNHATN
jgi:hypothetical protein